MILPRKLGELPVHKIRIIPCVPLRPLIDFRLFARAQVSNGTNRTSRSLPFINFQSRAAAGRWSEIWMCFSIKEAEIDTRIKKKKKMTPLSVKSKARTKVSSTKDTAHKDCSADYPQKAQVSDSKRRLWRYTHKAKFQVFFAAGLQGKI